MAKKELSVVTIPEVKPENKRRTFFYDMVTVDIFGWRQVEFDLQSINMSTKIRQVTERDDGIFTLNYAQRAVYTRAMYFNFTADVPEEYKNLETWWKKISNGEDDVECYLYYIRNIPNPLTNTYQDAIEDAHKIWKPVEEKEIAEDETDPN